MMLIFNFTLYTIIVGSFVCRTGRGKIVKFSSIPHETSKAHCIYSFTHTTEHAISTPTPIAQNVISLNIICPGAAALKFRYIRRLFAPVGHLIALFIEYRRREGTIESMPLGNDLRGSRPLPCGVQAIYFHQKKKKKSR